MEVSNEIKEEIRKTQTELKNAIRVHQIWVARLRGDVNNEHFKSKLILAEKDIIEIGQTQKLVLERLRRELEMYQQRLKSRNKQINIAIDNRLVAQQIRDHQIKFRSKNRTLLKPSVLSEIHIKAEEDDLKENISDPENDIKLNGKENHKEGFVRNFTQPNALQDNRNNFANALNKVKEGLSASNQSTEWRDQPSDSEYSHEPSPTPSPPPLPQPGEVITKEIFMRLIGLITPVQKETLEKKRQERRKRAINNPARNEFIYGNLDMLPKRKKYNQFPYLQQSNDPPQTRSAKLRKQQNTNKSSREGSPSGSSTENKAWTSSKPAWAASLPASLSVEPIFSAAKKICQVCGRNDVPSLLAYCIACGVWQHTACACAAEGGCASCHAPLQESEQREREHTTHSYRGQSHTYIPNTYCIACGVWQHTACACAAEGGCASCHAPLQESEQREREHTTHSYRGQSHAYIPNTYCIACGVWQHTACACAAEGGCASCHAPLQESEQREREHTTHSYRGQSHTYIPNTYCIACGVWQHTACACAAEGGCASCHAPLQESEQREREHTTHSYRGQSHTYIPNTYCIACGVWQHTACACAAEGGCASCHAPLQESEQREREHTTHSYRGQSHTYIPNTYCIACGVWQHTACACAAEGGCASCHAPLQESEQREREHTTHSYRGQSHTYIPNTYCIACGVWQHTACACAAEGGCASCHAPLQESEQREREHTTHSYRDKLAERKNLQERNIKLCVELRKLENRAAALNASLDDHHEEKRQLLSEQIKTQRNLQKLLDFISQFKETSVSVRSSSDSGSEHSKSDD